MDVAELIVQLAQEKHKEDMENKKLYVEIVLWDASHRQTYHRQTLFSMIPQDSVFIYNDAAFKFTETNFKYIINDIVKQYFLVQKLYIKQIFMNINNKKGLNRVLHTRLPKRLLYGIREYEALTYEQCGHPKLNAAYGHLWAYIVRFKNNGDVKK